MQEVNFKRARDIPLGFTGIAVFPSGTKMWIVNGQYHREDGPAIEWFTGETSWFRNGKLHRDDGPTFSHEDYREWRIDGKGVSATEVFEKMPTEKKEKAVWDIDNWK